MEGNLVIVESPTKARTIQRFLGPGFTVKASEGHIRDLQEKQLSIDIKGGFTPQYVIPDNKKRVVSELKKLASEAEIVWLASDEDREGEAISWHLSETLGLDKSRTRRIAFHEITKDAILRAIGNPREVDMNLVNAQQARRVLDRLVGFELSPILWKKIGRGLSAGRVQSVALRLVVDREREIMAFNPEAFYRVEGKFAAAGGAALKGVLDTRFKSAEEAEGFLRDSIGAAYHVSDVEKSEGKRYPAPPFTTSTLQQEASRKLRFPVSTTMRLAQSLYEKGLITYMRTDSTNLSALALGTAKKYILENFGAEYAHPRQYSTHSKGAQEAHEAIRPTFIEHAEVSGSAQEKALYNLIWKRTVASQMAEASLLNTTIRITSDKRSEQYSAEASEIVFDGFLKVYMESNDDETSEEGLTVVPDIHKGDALTAKEIMAECKFTRAPQRYTEASLVKKLEELGIGRPSTYAPTITTLTKTRGYLASGNRDGVRTEVTNFKLKGSELSSSTKKEVVGEDKGKLLPQDVGMMVTDYLVENFPKIMDYNYTADVEGRLDKIAEGEEDWREYLQFFYPKFHELVDNKLHDGQYTHVERVLGIDPADGQQIVAKYGQFGPYVQKGEGDDKRYASLDKTQLIESITLAEAIKLLALPRNVGEYEGIPIIATKGKFGPYLKYGGTNVTLSRKADPLAISLEECIEAIKAQKDAAPENNIIKEFKEEDIAIINGRYGPYIKHEGKNFRIPKNADAAALSLEDCQKIIAEAPTGTAKPTYRKTRKK
ncbi:MAG: type I DNA topoisomerase [Bacteroidales bacterium]|nr:type I DNA topoisomerase [Bacteroidales bacterium]